MWRGQNSILNSRQHCSHTLLQQPPSCFLEHHGLLHVSLPRAMRPLLPQASARLPDGDALSSARLGLLFRADELLCFPKDLCGVAQMCSISLISWADSIGVGQRIPAPAAMVSSTASRWCPQPCFRDLPRILVWRRNCASKLKWVLGTLNR